jgi:hypothetical protein
MKINRQIPIAVFLGPSLPLSRAESILQANYYPPAKLGDLYKLLTSELETIVIIDGLFDAATPTWHREILALLESGKKVYGASSMGALRACEMEPYGMRGHGQIFEWYRDGIIDGDDEVSLFHAHKELGYQKISEPLVNIRHNLARATERGILNLRQRDRLIQSVKEMYFGDRKISAMLELLADEPEVASRLSQFLKEEFVDLKAYDAVSVLKTVAEGNPACAEEAYPDSRDWYQRKVSHQGAMSDVELLYRAAITREGDVLPNEKMLAGIAQGWGNFSHLLHPATESQFLRFWVGSQSVNKDEQSPELILDEWCQKQSVHDLHLWLMKNGLLKAELLAEIHLRKNLAVCLKEFRDKNLEIVSQSMKLILSAMEMPQAWCPSFIEGEVEDFVLRALAVVDWADTNGFVAPNESLLPVSWQHDLNGDHHENWLSKIDLTPKAFNAFQQTFTTYAWLMAMGPAYFGFNWDPVIQVFRSLQMDGEVSELT